MRKCTRHIARQLVKVAMNQNLPPEEQAMLEEHLKVCADCRQIAERMYAERKNRAGDLRAPLSRPEKDELKRNVLQRIREIDPESR